MRIFWFREKNFFMGWKVLLTGWKKAEKKKKKAEKLKRFTFRLLAVLILKTLGNLKVSLEFTLIINVVFSLTGCFQQVSPPKSKPAQKIAAAAASEFFSFLETVMQIRNYSITKNADIFRLPRHKFETALKQHFYFSVKQRSFFHFEQKSDSFVISFPSNL